VKLVSQILAQALTDIGPVGGEIHGFGIFHQVFVGLAASGPRLVSPVHKLIPNSRTARKACPEAPQTHFNPLRQAMPFPPRESRSRGTPLSASL
jgi:hypothetical protein